MRPTLFRLHVIHGHGNTGEASIFRRDHAAAALEGHVSSESSLDPEYQQCIHVYLRLTAEAGWFRLETCEALRIAAIED